MRVKLLISYDGTDYAGWQKQAEDAADRRPTVQATLESALGRMFDSPVKTVASGRTDAGVHAEAQIVHFDCPVSSSTGEVKNLPHSLVRGLNALTPDSLGILKAWEVPADFHALHSATHKTYRYIIHNSPTPDPLSTRFHSWVTKPLDINRLNGIVEPLIGEHDFKSFQTSGTEIKTTVRRILEAHWSPRENDKIELVITGTGFLKQMVRNIVGTTLYLHNNHGSPVEMRAILEAHDRQSAKGTAEAKGLFLKAVYYPPDLDNKCREL